MLAVPLEVRVDALAHKMGNRGGFREPLGNSGGLDWPLDRQSVDSPRVAPGGGGRARVDWREFADAWPLGGNPRPSSRMVAPPSARRPLETSWMPIP